MSMFTRFFGSKAEASANLDDPLDEISGIASKSTSDDDNNADDGQLAETATKGDKQKHNKKQQQQDDKSSSQDDPLLPEELCEIPTFLNSSTCDKLLIEETRRLLKKKYLKRPDAFQKGDYERMLSDDWTVSRFLLRCRLQPKRAARLMEDCGKFRIEYRMGVSKLSDFPIEFHRVGGLFKYAPDRVGNQTLYMRIKYHRRVPELSQIMREFILCCLECCDRANNGRGTAVIFDLTGCGLQNVDPGFLFWLVYSFRNYCPKGLSYIIIYNLPWILNATAKLALSWLSSTNKRRLRFVSGDGIRDFIAPENLPDYMGGTCKINYKQVPEGSRLAVDTAEAYKLTREQSKKLSEVYDKFLEEIEADNKVVSEAKNESDDTSEEKPESVGIISSGMVAS